MDRLHFVLLTMKWESDERINTDHSPGIFHLHGFLSVSAPHFSSIHHFIPILLLRGFSSYGQSGLFRFIHFFVPKVRSTTRPPFSLILLAVWPNCPPPHIGGMNISLWKKKAFNLGPAYSIFMTVVIISVVFILVKASQLNKLVHHLAQLLLL